MPFSVIAIGDVPGLVQFDSLFHTLFCTYLEIKPIKRQSCLFEFFKKRICEGLAATNPERSLVSSSSVLLPTGSLRQKPEQGLLVVKVRVLELE